MSRHTSHTLIAFLLMTLAAPAAFADDGVLRFEVRTPAPTLRTMQSGLTSVLSSESGNNALPGQPLLPVRVVRLAIPPQADAESVRVEVVPAAQTTLPGRFDVLPAPPIALVDGRSVSWGPHSARIVLGRDTGIYAKNTLFPASWGRAAPSVGTLRRFRFVEIMLHPVRYLPSDGTLIHAEKLDIALRYEKHDAAPAPGTDCGSDDLAKRLLDNYDIARTWYPPHCSPLTEDHMGVAIITTEDIKWGSELLDDYVALRNSQGYDADVYTEIDWDVTTANIERDDRADRIRLWLKKNYESRGLGYVFIIGNPSPEDDYKYGIPMKYCGVMEDSMMGKVAAPTDLYYGDLDGDWDDNGNGVLCEYGNDNEDIEPDGVTLTPELYVGRIPVYSDGPAAVDGILSRILEYEADTEDGDLSWRRRMLLPNSIYFYEMQEGSTAPQRWDGAAVGEWFIRDLFRPRGLVWTTMYEREGISPSNFDSHLPLNPEQLVDQWVRGYGFVFWTGHGSNTGVYRLWWEEDTNGDEMPSYGEYHSPEFMGTDMLHMLVDTPPPFVIHGSCSNGTPEDANNLAYNMLRRGAIATLSATRVAATWHWPDYETEVWEKLETWDGDVIDIVTEFSVNLLDGMPAAEAIGEALALTANTAGDTSLYQKSIQNLYGDPLVRLVVCRVDKDCDNQILCDGEEICKAGTCAPGQAVVCEPENDCEDMICEEGTGCVPAEECEQTDADAGTDTDVDSDSDTEGDTSSDTSTDTDTSAPSGDEPVDPENLSAKSSCRAAPSRSWSNTLVGLLTKLFS